MRTAFGLTERSLRFIGIFAWRELEWAHCRVMKLGMIVWVPQAIEVDEDGSCTFVPDPFARPNVAVVAWNDHGRFTTAAVTSGRGSNGNANNSCRRSG